MKAIRYEKDSVLIQKGSIKAWVDVVVYDGKLNYDWNKFIFFLNSKDDVVLRKWQDNIDNFEDATSLAIETLENQGIIFLDNNDKWHITEKYHIIKGAIPIKQ
jgi:hypothetical protein